MPQSSATLSLFHFTFFKAILSPFIFLLARPKLPTQFLSLMAEKTADPSINHKTCVLKASIHCEGCKRKVKKILSQVHGVTFVDVDTKLQKVTITVSGNVEADVLINKLVKAGKHAELWPEKVIEKNDNFSGFGKNREKLVEKTQSKTEIDRLQTKPTSDTNVVKEIDPSGKVDLVQNPASSSSVIENGEKTGGTAKVDEGGAEKGSGESGGVTGGKVEVVTDASMKSSSSGVQETESVGKQKVEDSSAGGEPPKAAEKGNNSGGNEVGSTAGKKKKKKGQNGNLATTLPSSAAGGTGSENHEPSVPIPTNQIHPRHHDNPYVPPNNFYVPPASVYGVSYNTAYPPSSSYTASYYATPPPYSYAYTYPGRENEPPPSDPESHPQRTLDSFELFSDENPNGCTIA